MDYNRIVAITGLPGLYEVVSSKTDGAIVRSLEDQSTKFISSRIHNLSHLESIEVYTVKDNVTLADVFSSMKENKTKLPELKDNKELKAYFEKVFPDLDQERVYSSDMKKMIRWFEILQQNNIDFTVKPEQKEEEAVPETVEAQEVKTPKAKTKETTAKAKEEPKAKAAPKKKAKESPEKETKPKKAAKKK